MQVITRTAPAHRTAHTRWTIVQEMFLRLSDAHEAAPCLWRRRSNAPDRARQIVRAPVHLDAPGIDTNGNTHPTPRPLQKKDTDNRVSDHPTGKKTINIRAIRREKKTPTSWREKQNREKTLGQPQGTTKRRQKSTFSKHTRRAHRRTNTTQKTKGRQNTQIQEREFQRQVQKQINARTSKTPEINYKPREDVPVKFTKVVFYARARLRKCDRGGNARQDDVRAFQMVLNV